MKASMDYKQGFFSVCTPKIEPIFPRDFLIDLAVLPCCFCNLFAVFSEKSANSANKN